MLEIEVKGPTASGKTTAIAAIAAVLSLQGKDVVIVNHEDPRFVLAEQLRLHEADVSRVAIVAKTNELELRAVRADVVIRESHTCPVRLVV